MAARIVVFGATGYTGRLVSERLVAQGVRPVLAGRSEEKLRALAQRLGGLGWEVADVDRETSMSDLVRRGDVLVSHGGPVRALGRAGGARRGGGRRRLPGLHGRAAVHPPRVHRVRRAGAPLGLRAPARDGLRLRAGRACRRARAARGGRARGPRRRRLLRARRRAELDVARHARVARRHRPRPLLRVPRRRRADGALGGADAHVPRQGQGAAGDLRRRRGALHGAAAVRRTCAR